MKRDLNKILTKGKIIMQNNAPFDTGNLRFNAIKKLRKNSSSGIIRVDGKDAYYAQYLNEIPTSKHKGWITVGSAEISQMVTHEISPVYRTRYVRLNKPHLISENLRQREETLLYSRLRYDKEIDIK